jgi:hypothetical protein
MAQPSQDLFGESSHVLGNLPMSLIDFVKTHMTMSWPQKHQKL